MNKKYKILIVDDYPEWLNNHKTLLEQLFGEDFFEIHTADNGKNGFNKAVQNSYDLIITDLEMEKNLGEPYAGSWLIKSLLSKEQCINTKFLIISGAYNIWDVANSLKVGYIAKSSLISNPLLIKYKLKELLQLDL
jgi:YesN/AraC family two-component response regulator